VSTRDFYPPDLDAARTLVGRGWWPLLERVYEMAEAEQVRPFQIKEKFAGLSVSWHPEDIRRVGRETLLTLTQELEARSYKMCEACGAPGEPVQARLGDWKKTLCPGHATMRRQGALWHEIYGFQPYTTPLEGAESDDEIELMLEDLQATPGHQRLIREAIGLSSGEAEDDDEMSDLERAWGVDKLPYRNAQATHECPERARHLQTIRWDLEGYEGLFGPAVTRVQRWAGRWWAHNEEYATEISHCPWCGELLDRLNSPE
jgi:hypothetical protein